MKQHLGISLLLVVSGASLSAASFQGLGDLAGSTFFSEGVGISADGRVAVGYSQSTSSGSQFEAFRWSTGLGMVGLGDLPGDIFMSNAVATSADGSIVVGASKSTDGGGFYQEAFRWSSATGMLPLGDLPGGLFFSNASGISADGTTIVGGSSSYSGPVSGMQAFKWTEATGMVGLGNLAGGIEYSTATAISGNASIIVGYSSSSNNPDSFTFEAFRWSASAGMIGLGDLGGGAFDSRANDISFDGNVIVGAGKSTTSGTGFEAMRWTLSTGMVGLGDLPGGSFYSIANATSGNGSVIVGSGRTDAGDEAFIWDPLHGMRSLKAVLIEYYGITELASWHLRSAYDISADGLTIIGSGTNPAGKTEAWLVTIPEPSCGLLLVSGAISILTFRRTAKPRTRTRASAP